MLCGSIELDLFREVRIIDKELSGNKLFNHGIGLIDLDDDGYSHIRKNVTVDLTAFG